MRVTRPSEPAVRRAAAGLACAVLLAPLASCTGGADEPSAARGPGGQSTGASRTLEAKPVPLNVRVTRVAGTLKPADRTSLEHNVGLVVQRYFDGAFLGGSYPRSSFDAAFAGFTPGAAQRARGDRDLLTNADLGPTTESVTAKEQDAYLSVLAPNKVAAGVTARVRLVLVADRGDKPDQRVTLTGRLLLTRKKSGGWQIFGYDVARSAVATGKGAS